MAELLALGVRPPDAVGAFLGGRRAAQDERRLALGERQAGLQERDANLKNVRNTMEMIGSVALGSMGGKLDGEPDPKLFEQGLDFLEQNGMDVAKYRGKPELAKVAARGSLDVIQAMTQARNEQELQLRMQKFQFDMDESAQRLELERQKLANDMSGAAETGLNPQYGYDAEGNPVLLQTTKRGEAVRTKLPEGVRIMDPKSKAFETASGREGGQQQAEAAANLPKVEGQANAMLGVINRLENHRGMKAAIGSIEGRLPSFASPLKMQDIDNFRALREQLLGGAFLQAFESIKGGGHITEVEGIKATNAITALQETQDEKQFGDNLKILKEVIANGVARAKRKAGMGVETETYRSETVLPPDQRRSLIDPAGENVTTGGVKWRMK